MYFDLPENCFVKRFNNLQYQDPKSVLCGYYCLFFIKKYQEGNSFYDILYKLLDPLNQEINEIIIKTYYINHRNV